MNVWLQHLPVVPIVTPLVAGATILLLQESRRILRLSVAFASIVVQLASALVLLYLTTDAVPDVWQQGIGVYSIGAWPAPFGIVLVVDRLSALMLSLGAAVALASFVYSMARWDRVSPHYHTLYQFLLMGLNGAFLTGDLFNLFVFFEVLLASSYGLLLHGSGVSRVTTGLHYIVVNLVSALLFLIGVALIYGVTGTLNMADLVGRIAVLAPADRALFETGAAILGVAFLVKAGCWPLNFWMPAAYAAAGAPVAAAFSMLTKVGIYAVIRVGTLIASADTEASFIGEGLFYAGLATIVYGTIGTLASQRLVKLVSYSVVVSSGILLMALGLNAEALISPALFYLLSSVLATAAFFLLAGMTERTRTQVTAGADIAPLPAITDGAFGGPDLPDPQAPDDEAGIAIPAVMAFLGMAFVCCVLIVSGLPPLSGFVAKFGLLSTAINLASDTEFSFAVWAMVIAILGAGLAAVIALTRVGMRLFWTVIGRTTPRLRLIEAGPVAFLIALCIALTIAAAPVTTYLDSTARSLHSPKTYIHAVLSAQAGAGVVKEQP